MEVIWFYMDPTLKFYQVVHSLVSSHILNVCRKGDPTSSLCNLPSCLTALKAKNLFLTPGCDLCPLLLIFSLHTSESVLYHEVAEVRN